MLNTASDYKFLKTTDIGSFINGDIMPLKFPNKNTIAPVRFEDYLFLTEGFLERMNVEQAGSNNTLPPVRTIYASKILGSVIDSINGTASGPAMGYNGHRGYYINPDSNVRTDNLTVSGNTSIAILGDYVTNYKFDTVAIKMPSELKPSNYARRPLFAEYIRARYYDLNRLKLLSFRTAIGDLAESATTYYYDTNGQITSS